MKRLLGYIPWTRWWRARRLCNAICAISPLDTPFLSLETQEASKRRSEILSAWMDDTLKEHE